MESGGHLVAELERGFELTKQLGDQLNQFCPAELSNELLLGIRASWEKSILMAKLNNNPAGELHLIDTALIPAATVGMDSPRSTSLSRGSGSTCRSEHFNEQDRKEVSKKRKALPKWTSQVQVCSGTMEGPVDDGYSWRKYGQKDILGAKFPRAYYRCTNLKTQGCLATRQVQRSDKNPSIFEITYKGEHSCHQRPAGGGAGAGAEKKNTQSTVLQINDLRSSTSFNNMIFENFKASLKVETDLDRQEDFTSSFSFPSSTPASTGLGNENNNNNIFSSPPTLESHRYAANSFSPFVSPATSESNYFSVSPCHMSSMGGASSYLHGSSECDLAEIVSAAAFPEIASATASTTNSPIIDWDFSLEHLEFNPSFPYDDSFFA